MYGAECSIIANRSKISGEINLANFDREALMKVIPTAEHGYDRRWDKKKDTKRAVAN